MKIFWVLSFSVFSIFTGVRVLAEDVGQPCAERGLQYCQLPNIGENCNIGTCNASLASSGDCTVEAIYNADESALVSCRVCSTSSIDAESCQSLGGTVKRAS